MRLPPIGICLSEPCQAEALRDGEDNHASQGSEDGDHYLLPNLSESLKERPRGFVSAIQENPWHGEHECGHDPNRQREENLPHARVHRRVRDNLRPRQLPDLRVA